MPGVSRSRPSSRIRRVCDADGAHAGAHLCSCQRPLMSVARSSACPASAREPPDLGGPLGEVAGSSWSRRTAPAAAPSSPRTAPVEDGEHAPRRGRSTVASSSSTGTTMVARPSCAASSASIHRPVSADLEGSGVSDRSTSGWVPPRSGTRPSDGLAHRRTRVVGERPAGRRPARAGSRRRPRGPARPRSLIIGSAQPAEPVLERAIRSSSCVGRRAPPAPTATARPGRRPVEHPPVEAGGERRALATHDDDPTVVERRTDLGAAPPTSLGVWALRRSGGQA